MDANNPRAGSLELTGLVRLWSFHFRERICLKAAGCTATDEATNMLLWLLHAEHTSTQAHAYTCMQHTQTHSLTHTLTCTVSHTCMHTDTHTHRCMHTHTYRHSHTDTHAHWLVLPGGSLTSSRSLCLSSRSVSSFCCKLRAFISSMACFFSRSLS